ncbi:MAG: HYR domain-containing protein [Cyclobacteriaceae bacterium]|nr:HYR domain-containing protein [Cyclobacteriaceae bacterium]
MKKKFQNYQLVAFVVLVISFFAGYQSHAQRYPAVFDPTTVAFNGTNGFVVPGLDAANKLGNEDVQFIGDINNDGIEDFAMGNSSESVGALSSAGKTYIIFGSTTSFPTPFDLTTLDGTNGFVVEGAVANGQRGSTIAGLGDINGDGIDDLIIGSRNSGVDEIVLYGTATFPALITVNDINGTNGFLIDTPGIRQVAALGDVNGDLINDFIIGTPHWSGQSWVIFGRSSNYPALLDVSWLNGINGFRISDFAGSRPAYFVGGAGDINNDSYNDILIGNWASSFDAPGEISYVLFGKNTPFDVLVDIEAVDGTDGFLIDNQGNAFLTYVGPIGDINDDGIDDCFSENNIILGSSTAFPDSLFMSDLNGSNGFVLDNTVLGAASVGDLNLDGIGDFIVASTSDHYVVYGKTGGFPALFDPSTLDGTNGFQIPNVASSGTGGRTIDGGKDINGDGFSDFIFGDRNFGSTGRVYVVFGGDFVAPTITCPASQELCVGAVLPDYTGLATATDTEDPNPAITQSPVVGAAFTDGMVITLTATDASGNFSSCTFIVNQLADTTNPVITCPSSQSLAFGAAIPDYTSLATATDNCGVAPAVTQSPVAGTAFADGMTITLTATDGSGNTSNCNFIINKLPDTIVPEITCPGNQELTCNDTVIPDYTSLATATDTEDPNPTITQSPAVGSAFTDGMAITLTATDASENASSCNFTVTELPAPSVAASATATTVCAGEEIALTASGNAESYIWDNGVTDGVAFAPTATTTYTVIGTDINSCEATAQITITVNLLPEQPIISVAESMLISSSAVGNQWFMDGSAISGAVQQSYTISTGSAVYTVQVTIDDCASDMSDPVIITGLNELISKETLSIWPNPVSNQIFVKLISNSTVNRYLIINSIGTVVKSGKFKKTELVQNFDVMLYELRSGIYTIQVFADKGIIQAKFIKY